MNLEPRFSTPLTTLYCGDSAEVQRFLPDESIDCCITSPPYFQKADYQTGNDQLGWEDAIDSYFENLQAIFTETYRLMRPGGCLWIAIDDTYNNVSFIGKGSADRKLAGSRGKTHRRRKLTRGYREKELLGIPIGLIDYLRDIDWLHRSFCIWDKGTTGDAKAEDRPRLSHEYVLMFFKPECSSGRPHANCKPLPSTLLRFDAESDPSRNPNRHPCPFPVELVKHLLAYSCPDGGVVLDPFAGSGRTLVAATQMGVKSIGIEISERFCDRAVQYYQEKIYPNAA